MRSKYALKRLRGSCYFLTACTVLMIPANLSRAAEVSDNSPSLDAVRVRSEELLQDQSLTGGIAGVKLVKIKDRSVVFAHNPQIRLMPASNRKVFTAASALRLLGPEYQFKTTVLAAGPIAPDGSVARGVCLKGAGDAAIDDKALDDLADQLYRRGVRRVAGNVYGDGTLFPAGEEYGEGWGWDYLSDDYAAAIAGLEVNDGDFTVQVAAGARAGDPAAVTLAPAVSHIPIYNRAVTGSKDAESTLTIRRDWDHDTVTVTGVMPADTKTKQVFAVADPVRYAAEAFRLSLIRRGIAVDGHAVTMSESLKNAPVLATYASLPMRSYIALMLKPSDNLIAESLIRVMGLSAASPVSGSEHAAAGSYASGHLREKQYFQSIGIAPEACDFSDGSGVSRRDNVTADAVCTLLLAMTRSPNYKDFYAGLPVMGIDGTLKNRMKGTAFVGKTHAKTGTLTGACALSGYFTAQSGDGYVFSILLNNYPGKVSRVREIQDSLLAYWIGYL